LPNYTCTETVQRSQHAKFNGQDHVLMSETVRLEIAYVDGAELFGWPGSAKIDESDIHKMIEGSIGNGYFALLSHSIFATSFADIEFGDQSGLDGKPAVRYGYRISKNTGAYTISGEVGKAAVDFHGSFWVNPKTLDLLRISAIVDNPPPVVGVKSAESVLDFERQSIGGSTFVLPRKAELTVVDDGGAENLSHLTFASCHQFVGESVIKFDASTDESAAQSAVKAATMPVALPDDFTVDFNLDSPIEWGVAAGGDPVHGTLRGAVQQGGRVLLPKGARLSGRISHVALRGDLYYVELVLTALDCPGSHADLNGRRNGIALKDAPLIFTSSKFKLDRNARLTLHSRLLKSIRNDPARP
ncbi:MAG TPA: hypothetical protein VKT81_07550, partial [Bryobacteraceae bacterium]|nr:hypothetical protein [Bryobacteraceae bacterium]